MLLNYYSCAAVLGNSIQWAMLFFPVTCFHYRVTKMCDHLLPVVTLAESAGNAHPSARRRLSG